MTTPRRTDRVDAVRRRRSEINLAVLVFVAVFTFVALSAGGVLLPVVAGVFAVPIGALLSRRRGGPRRFLTTTGAVRAVVVYSVLALLLGGCATGGAEPYHRTAAPTVAAQTAANGCVAGDHPDPACTPGAVNPDVTQDTIGATVCVPGWSTKTRARLFPSSAAARVKVERMAAYQVAGKAAYELDHLVPISVGGAVDQVVNLWPEPRAGVHGADAKDKVENAVHADVCAGRLSLAQGQAVFLRGDW